jgi:putative transposase
LNVAVEVEAKPSAGTASVGIDLGLKECATTSAGDKLEGRWYRANEKALATAQRARKKARTRAIHAKIGNQRKDALHKFSTKLVKRTPPFLWAMWPAPSWSKPRWPKARWMRAGQC